MNNYHRVRFGFGDRGSTNTIKQLLIANAAVFILQYILSDRIIYYFALTPALVWTRFYFWQWFTYMFLHGGVMHLGFNMYVLWMFGSDIERMWGSRAFLQYYLITGVGAGIFYSLVRFGSGIPTIGASGAVYAILVAFAVMFPNRQIMMLFPPVALPARTLVMIFLGIEVFLGVTGSSDGIAHFAHLGGALVGYIYMKRGIQLPFRDIRNRLDQWKHHQEIKQKWKRQAELNRLRRLVDELLDKANDVGIENLSREEQDFLKRAGQILKDEEQD
ncbi:rhomboid family intramembrane serine protease [bacterium]|nr:rhomboid family intramembrane serine protease [bacterium]